LVEYEGVKTLLCNRELVDYSIGTAKFARIVYVVADRFQEIDDSLIEIFEVVRVQHVDDAFLGPI